MHDGYIELPRQIGLPVLDFSRVFENETNSYKYIFFISLIDILSSRNFNTSVSIQFTDLATEMLVNAWYPHTYFKLSFGKQDQIGNILDRVNFQTRPNHKDELRNCLIEHAGLTTQLMRYVPYRFLRAFFEPDLRGLRDSLVNDQVAAMSRNEFILRKPLYRIDGQSIVVHPEWGEYLKTNYRIVKAWAYWNWLDYMQRRNPSTPGIALKLFPPAVREPLTSQTKYWRVVINNAEVCCIYSGHRITSLSLDHYLPWSFIVHDRLWNLIPTSRSVNSSKLDRIPDTRYFEKFVEMQHLALVTTNRAMPEKQWHVAIEPYLQDLGLSTIAELLNAETLKCAYQRTLPSLLTLATNQGFISGWVYPYSVEK